MTLGVKHNLIADAQEGGNSVDSCGTPRQKSGLVCF